MHCENQKLILIKIDAIEILPGFYVDYQQVLIRSYRMISLHFHLMLLHVPELQPTTII